MAVRCGTAITAVHGPHSATTKQHRPASGNAAASKSGEPDLQRLEFGALVWAAGIGTRPVVRDLAAKINGMASCQQQEGQRGSHSSNKKKKEEGKVEAAVQGSRRGLVVDPFLRVKGVGDGSCFALGDCAVSGNPPTAQVAAQQGT